MGRRRMELLHSGELHPQRESDLPHLQPRRRRVPLRLRDAVHRGHGERVLRLLSQGQERRTTAVECGWTGSFGGQARRLRFTLGGFGDFVANTAQGANTGSFFRGGDRRRRPDVSGGA